ncbi:MAG: hypothetical protein ACTHMW_05730 [Actinomycetes bacterium]
MTAAIGTGSLLCTAGGLVAAAAALYATQQWRLALAVLLEFLTAAGLLRLVVATGYRAIASAALIVLIRHIVTFGLRARTGHARSGQAGSGQAGSGHARSRRARGRTTQSSVLERLRQEARIALRPAHR